MAYAFWSHEESEVTCLSDEFDNFRRMVMAQTTNVKNKKKADYMSKMILKPLQLS